MTLLLRRQAGAKGSGSTQVKTMVYVKSTLRWNFFLNCLGARRPARRARPCQAGASIAAWNPAPTARSSLPPAQKEVESFISRRKADAQSSLHPIAARDARHGGEPGRG